MAEWHSTRDSDRRRVNVQSKRWWAILTVLALVASACTAGGPGATTTTSQPPASQAAPTTAPAPAVPATPTGYAELDQALTETVTAADGTTVPIFKDKAVSIQTQWIGGEGANFAAAVADFVAKTGIKLQVDSIGSSHETVLRTRIQGGQPPDLAMLAQPTAVLAYGADSKVIDVATIMDPAKLKVEHEATIGLISDGDQIWGIPYKADVKSTVWYPIKYFEENDLAVPTTWDELIALSNSIKEKGSAPWCMGMEAGTATGWQFTDWVEEVMLRTQTPEKYNQWISHELPFNSPEVKAAFLKVGEIMFTEGYVFGGTTAITSTPQTQPFDGAFPKDGSDTWAGLKPDCAMHKIPTWYGPDFFPDVRAGGAGTVTKYEIGTDIGIFYLPPIDPAFGTPALGSADTLMVLKDRPEVRAVAQFLATPQGTQRWIEAGSAISANTSTPTEWYADAYKLDVAAKIVNDATYVGFDASDLMPPEVGAGTFWTEGVKFINAGGTNIDEVLAAIDATTIKPESKFGSW